MTMNRILTMTKMKMALAALLLNAGSLMGQGTAQKTLQAPSSLTLKEAVSLAIDHNFQVRQTGLQADAAKVNYDQSRENMLPSLNGFVNHGNNKGRSIDPFTNTYVDQNLSFASYNLTGDLLLFGGLNVQRTIQQNRLAWEAGKMDLDQLKDNTAMAVLLAYYQVLLNEDLLNIAKNQAGLTAQQVTRLETLDKEGAIPPATLYDLKGQYANDQLSIVNSNNAVNSSKLGLCQLVFIPYNRNLQLAREGMETVPAPYDSSAEALYQRALQHMSVVKAADLRVESAQKAVQAARSNYFPKLWLSGSLNSNYSSLSLKSIPGAIVETPTGGFVNVGGSKYDVLALQQQFTYEKFGYVDQLKNNYSTSVGLGLRIPILNGFQVKNQVRLARLNEKGQENIRENALLQLQQQVEQASFNAQAAYERYKASADQVNAFRESFRSAEVRFNAGAINSVDYLVAKNNLDRATINLTQSKYEFIFRTQVLDYFAGKKWW
jgi:outer membrane protein